MVRTNVTQPVAPRIVVIGIVVVVAAIIEAEGKIPVVAAMMMGAVPVKIPAAPLAIGIVAAPLMVGIPSAPLAVGLDRWRGIHRAH